MQLLRKIAFFLGALLLGAPCAQAQVTAPAAAEIVLPRAIASDSAAEVAREDTAIAVQRLFFSQRRRGRSQLILGGLEVGIISFYVFQKQPQTVYQYVSTDLLAAVGGYYAYQLVAGLTKLRRFRPQREKQVLATLDNGQPLPRWVRQKLRPSYFGAKVLDK